MRAERSPRIGWLWTMGLASLLAATAGCAGQSGTDNGATPGSGSGGAGGSDASSTANSGGADATSSTMACVPGAQQACSCSDDEGTTSESTQTCLQDGSGFGSCECACGDNLCEPLAGENCHTCKADCGTCAPCEYKSCAQAQIPPPTAAMIPTPLLDISLDHVAPLARMERLQQRLAQPDAGMRVIVGAFLPAREGEPETVSYLRGLYAEHPADAARVRAGLADAGLVDLADYASRFPAPDAPTQTMSLVDGATEECGAPMFRIRIAKVTVVEKHSATEKDVVYCAVTAESQAGDEVTVTPATSKLGKGDSYEYTITNGVVWGNAGPRSPGGALRLTYDCFEQDDPDGAKNLLDAIGAAAGSVGSIPGMPYGWAFGVGGVVLSGVGAIIGQNQDDHIFNATQTIAAADQLELTKGSTWTVSRRKSQTIGHWRWDLRMELWGCAQYGILP